MSDLNQQHARVLENLIPQLERRIEEARGESRHSEAEELRREVMHHRQVLASLQSKPAHGDDNLET
jgi:hypothetical protein